MSLPTPLNFSDWKTWASRLVQELSVPKVVLPLQLPSYSVSTLPPSNTKGLLIFVTDETGGAVVAFCDGTDWRRVTDRAVVS